MIITKIAQYNPYGPVKETAYEYVVSLLKGEVDPETEAPKQLEVGPGVVLHSTCKRAVECLSPVDGTKLIPTSELDELRFDFDTFCSKDDFYERGSDAVREAFIAAFMQNKLHLSHRELADQFNTILDQARIDSTISAVSHTFRMKLLQLYVTYGGELFTDSSIVIGAIPIDEHIFEFGETIEI